jgi:hypothetical protein
MPRFPRPTGPRDTTLRDAALLLAILVILVLARLADADPADAGERDAPIGDPPARVVVDAAIRHAGLAGDPGRALRRRARWAGLVPWVSVRAARDLGWTDTTSVTASGSAGIDVDHGEVLEVRATWRLDRLVFDGSETRALGLDASRARARRELAREVIHLYYRRQRLAADPAADPLELDEVTALLDELTGGWLTRR